MLLHARQESFTARKLPEKMHTKMTMPRGTSPRSMNIVEHILSGSGLRRPSPGSGLSVLQFERSADSENCGGEWIRM